VRCYSGGVSTATVEVCPLIILHREHGFGPALTESSAEVNFSKHLHIIE
jgi:hypothetical protein